MIACSLDQNFDVLHKMKIKDCSSVACMKKFRLQDVFAVAHDTGITFYSLQTSGFVNLSTYQIDQNFSASKSLGIIGQKEVVLLDRKKSELAILTLPKEL